MAAELSVVPSQVEGNARPGIRGGPRISLPVKSIVSLYKSGLSMAVIGQRFGVSLGTIQNRLKTAGVSRRRPGIQPGVLHLPEDKYEAFIELVDGLLLGDGCLAANGRLLISQMDHRIGWLHQIVEDLRLFGCVAVVRSRHVGRDFWLRGKKYRAKPSSVLETLVYEELKVQRARWYPNSSATKRVPHDVRVTPKSIAHWFAGDGSFGRYGGLSFYTNSFTSAEVERLARALPVESHRVPTARPGQSIIVVTKRNEAVKLADTIRCHLHDCCLYKLRFVRPRIRKLPMSASTVRELRRLYMTGEWTQQALGDRFGVSQGRVSDAVHWHTFKEIDPNQSPTANPTGT